jgi:hypothetical protein
MEFRLAACCINFAFGVANDAVLSFFYFIISHIHACIIRAHAKKYRLKELNILE